MTSYSHTKRTLKFLNPVQRHSMANFGFWAGIIKDDRLFWNNPKRDLKYNFRLAKFKIANWAGSVNWNLISLTAVVIRFHLGFCFVFNTLHYRLVIRKWWAVYIKVLKVFLVSMGWKSRLSHHQTIHITGSVCWVCIKVIHLWRAPWIQLTQKLKSWIMSQISG